MQYFLLIYFNSKPLHVSRRLAAHHQEDQLCINSNWHMSCVMFVDWLLAGSCLALFGKDLPNILVTCTGSCKNYFNEI